MKRKRLERNGGQGLTPQRAAKRQRQLQSRGVEFGV